MNINDKTASSIMLFAVLISSVYTALNVIGLFVSDNPLDHQLMRVAGGALVSVACLIVSVVLHVRSKRQNQGRARNNPRPARASSDK